MTASTPSGDDVVLYDLVALGGVVVGRAELPRGISIRHAPPKASAGRPLSPGEALFEVVRKGNGIGFAPLPAATSWVRRASSSVGGKPKPPEQPERAPAGSPNGLNPTARQEQPEPPEQSKQPDDSADAPVSPDNKPEPVALDIEITLLEKLAYGRGNNQFTKTIKSNSNGGFESDGSPCKMTRGKATRKVIHSLAELGDIFQSFGKQHGIALGRLRDGLPDNDNIIVTKEEKAAGKVKPEVIARTQEFFDYAPGRQALALIDTDYKGMPPQMRDRIDQAGGLQAVLAGVLPALADAHRLVRPSTSSGLYNAETGEQLAGSANTHTYLAIQDGADAERFLRTLFKRFWLTGFGWHYLSRAGIPLKRSLVDEFVYGAERVIFEGPPVVLSPLKQDQKARQPIVLGHEVIDSKAACPDLTQEEETEFAALVEADKKRLAPEISAARERYLAEETDALVKAKGLGEREARAIVEQRCSGVLATSDVLSWDDSRLAGVTVADILHNPKKYAGKTLADPLEGVSYGTNKAKVVLRADGRPMITSFAHGKTNYWLKWDYVAIAAAIAAEEASKAVAALQAHLANPSHVVLTEEEREQLIKLTAERSGLDIEAVKEAVSGQTIPNASQRPCYRVFDEQVTSGLEKFRPGVWHFSIKPATSRTPEQRIDLWIATPIHILAVTHDDMDMNFGRCLRIRNANRRWRTWAMPMEMLAGDGTELRAELLAMGVEIDPHSKLLLASYLQSHHPERRMRCALHVGWHGQSFVLPDMVIGPGAPDIIFQSGELDLEDWGIGGTLEGWKTEVAALAVGNPLLQLSISTAFVGPLLARCFAEGGGLHFFGDSSIGKTTGVDAAASVWGGKDFKRSWRATANGLESIATLHNDCLLPLDEISECSSKEINAASYMLANGRGKQRASRTGSARSVKQWRCFVISSGEKTLATAMLEGDVHAKAGQAVRLLDVPCKRNFGFFDTLSGFANASAFSDTLRQSAKEHYGHAGRLFLEKLTHDGRDMGARLKLLKEAKAFNVGAEGQDKRVAARFAIVALAGELAIEYGVVPWPEGDAAKAALIGLETWQSQRPALGNAEPRQIIEQVSAFIDRHSDARFSHKESSVENVRDRAGWWDEDTDGNRSYLFTGAGLREATIRFDFSRVLDALQAAGALVLPNEVGRRVKSMRIGGRKVKVYEVLADKLGDA